MFCEACFPLPFIAIVSQVAAKPSLSETGSKGSDGDVKKEADDSGSDEAPAGGMMSLLKRFGGGAESVARAKAKPVPKSRAARVEPRAKAASGVVKKASTTEKSEKSLPEKSKGKNVAPAKTVVGNAGTFLVYKTEYFFVLFMLLSCLLYSLYLFD